MAKGFQTLFPMAQHPDFTWFNLEVNQIKTPLLGKTVCFGQKQARAVITKKPFHLRKDTMLLPPPADVRLRCFFKLERRSYVSITSPSNYATLFSLSAAVLLMPFKCFCLASVIVKSVYWCQRRYLVFYKPGNVSQNSVQESAPWISRFAVVAWGRNIWRWLFSTCPPVLYFSLLHCFLKNGASRGEHYFETFSWCHWIILPPLFAALSKF